MTGNNKMQIMKDLSENLFFSNKILYFVRINLVLPYQTLRFGSYCSRNFQYHNYFNSQWLECFVLEVCVRTICNDCLYV
jgi:hypothetical protein